MLCICQGKVRNLRRATEAEGKPAAVAAVDVTVRIADLDHAPGIFEYREKRLTEEAELAPMGMACQGQGDAISGTIVDAFWMMCKQDGEGIFGQIFHSLLHIILTLLFKMRPVHWIVNTEHVEVLSGHFAALIYKDVYARLGEVLADGINTAEVLMIAEAEPDTIGE